MLGTMPRRSVSTALLVAFCVAAGTAPDALAAEDAAVSMRIGQDGKSVTISAAGRPVLVYRFGDVPMKPYVKELYSPAGVQILRDSPHDHKHHHALMYAVGIDGVDFWSENAKCGRQLHRRLEQIKATADGGRAGFIEDLDWVAPGSDKPLATERRTIRVLRPADAPASLITWHTRLEPAAGRPSIQLGGSHYFGLGMRFVQSMDKVGRFFNAESKEGTPVRGTERLTRTRWCAYTAPAAGKTVTVAMFDASDNPRHPARFFTMPEHFAYISATLNLWKEPLTVRAGQPLTLRYAVALWDGAVPAAAVEKLYGQWERRRNDE